MLCGGTEMGPGRLIMLCGGVKITPWALKTSRFDGKKFNWGPHGMHFNVRMVTQEPMMLYGVTEMGPGPLKMLCGGVKITPWAVKASRFDDKKTQLEPARDAF